jgi:hypothetical protein
LARLSSFLPGSSRGIMMRPTSFAASIIPVSFFGTMSHRQNWLGRQRVSVAYRHRQNAATNSDKATSLDANVRTILRRAVTGWCWKSVAIRYLYWGRIQFHPRSAPEVGFYLYRHRFQGLVRLITTITFFCELLCDLEVSHNSVTFK